MTRVYTRQMVICQDNACYHTEHVAMRRKKLC